MTDDIDDLFDPAPAAPKYGLDQAIHRYRFPSPPGFTRPDRARPGWRRTTNLVKAFSDQYALQLWLERATLLGLLANDGLIFDEMATSGVDGIGGLPRAQTDELAAWAEKARTAVGADTGARKGTARHSVLEHYIFAGEVIGHRRMRVQMHELIKLMDECDFEFIPGSEEAFVFHPIGGGTVGKRDARFLCRRTGQIGTIDLKTQERFWTYQEHAGQQWIYDTAPFTWEGPLDDTGRWVPQAAGTYVGRPGGVCEGRAAALLIHMPSKATGTPVQLVELDLEYGGKVARLAEQVVELRSAGEKAGGICPA